MDRRTAVVVGTASVSIVLALLVASSGPVRVWSNPTDPAEAPLVSVTTSTVARGAAEVVPASGSGLRWGGNVLPIIGVALLLALVLVSARAMAGYDWTRRGSGSGRRRGSGMLLPAVEQPDVVVDFESVERALAEGEPRNAIVACWMQLEKDAAAAGWQRVAAETSAEYAERVIAAASVDPGPIRDLAHLFRIARFSQHEMGEADRTRARDALRMVVESLPRRASEPV